MNQFDVINLLRTKKFKDFWFKLADLIQTYFRVEVEGIENIPKTGPALIISNHSGYSGVDAILIAHILHSQAKRIPIILAHRAYFCWSHWIRLISLSFGLRMASVGDGVDVLEHEKLLIIFPEGEAGNFKSSLKRYQLQKFHSGFVRIAATAHVPIVPCVVLGAEESFINLGSLDFSQFVKGLRIPIPLSLIPLPAKWKIRFLPPINTEKLGEISLTDHDRVAEVSHQLQENLQMILNRELKKRPYIFFPSPHTFVG